MDHQPSMPRPNQVCNNIDNSWCSMPANKNRSSFPSSATSDGKSKWGRFITDKPDCGELDSDDDNERADSVSYSGNVNVRNNSKWGKFITNEPEPDDDCTYGEIDSDWNKAGVVEEICKNGTSKWGKFITNEQGCNEPTYGEGDFNSQKVGVAADVYKNPKSKWGSFIANTDEADEDTGDNEECSELIDASGVTEVQRVNKGGNSKWGRFADARETDLKTSPAIAKSVGVTHSTGGRDHYSKHGKSEERSSNVLMAKSNSLFNTGDLNETDFDLEF